MSKYIIWDKQSQVITPIGEVFSAEEWMDRYPMAKIESIDLVLNGLSAINGAICNEFTSFKSMYEQQGCDFSECETRQDCLDTIEEFENQKQIEAQEQSINYISPEERLAAANEAQVLIALEQMANSNE